MLKTTKRVLLFLGAAAVFASCDAGGSGGDPLPGTGGSGGSPIAKDGGLVPEPKRGQTEFTTEEPGSTRGADRGAQGTSAGAPSPSGGAAADSAAKEAAPAAPGGRLADVEEADIYKMDGNRLYYFNTYRGFVTFDVTDAKKPVRLGRLPVYGYPVEMFVDGTTVYALLKDALYLTQTSGKLQFDKKHVSQLVAIDVSDPRNPQLLKTIDIVGHLREGVSRKVENTIYVVSYVPRYYYWRGGQAPADKEQAWVYSFDVSNKREPAKVGELKIFEGGSINVRDPKTGSSLNRNFQDVAIGATSNALMVVENWWVNAYQAPSMTSPAPDAKPGSTAPSMGAAPRQPSCGSYESNQQARVSIVDISDPKGTIRLHTAFETSGRLQDQFKHTYVFDEKTKTGTYHGIFARQVWSSAGCQGRQETRNVFESWDVTNGAAPSKLGSLDFGKPDETVRGSAFDVDRKVAYAITARQIDPLYAISFADRAKPTILSAIDGLSGSISVFRLVGNKQFLVGVGQDTSATCTGFQDTMSWRPVNMAVSLIDVRDLSKIRLVQRQCVAVQNAGWGVSSQLTWNMDQAHKMLGMHADGDLNVITVPVSYSKKNEDGDWWWSKWETAVGIMSWDLTKYDDRKSEKEQTVIANHGTFVHPNGEVRRSILFRHAATAQRMMINLSDTHVSIANIQDLAKPALEANVELAPYVSRIFRFGAHVVEQVQPTQNWYDALAEFRVKVAGGELDDKEPVARFSVPQVSQVLQHGSSLLVFRQVPKPRQPSGTYVPPEYEVQVFDLSNPADPKLASRTRVPMQSFPYARFWCGVGGYWGGYWFDGNRGDSFAVTDRGVAFLTQQYETNAYKTKIVFLDLQDLRAPKVVSTDLPGTDVWGSYALIGDPADAKGFYLGYRTRVGEVMVGKATFTRYKDFAQRWEIDGGVPKAKHDVNLPGRLVKTWTQGGERLFLAQDQSYKEVTVDGNVAYRAEMRLSLLRGVVVDGKAAAELREARVFTGQALSGLTVDGDRLYATARNGGYGYYYGDVALPPRSGSAGGVAVGPGAPAVESSDRLLVFDLSQGTLRLAYEGATGLQGVQIMGTHQGRLFLNLAQDGILAVDTKDAGRPTGLRFLRTLGYATHIEFAGNDAYVAAGNFGVYRLDLGAAPAIPLE